MLRACGTGIAAQRDRKPPAHPSASCRRRGGEVRMLEAQPLIVEQAATSRLGVQFVENAVEHRLIADHTPHTLPSTWPRNEWNCG